MTARGRNRGRGLRGGGQQPNGSYRANNSSGHPSTGSRGSPSTGGVQETTNGDHTSTRGGHASNRSTNHANGRGYHSNGSAPRATRIVSKPRVSASGNVFKVLNGKGELRDIIVPAEIVDLIISFVSNRFLFRGVERACATG